MGNGHENDAAQVRGIENEVRLASDPLRAELQGSVVRIWHSCWDLRFQAKKKSHKNLVLKQLHGVRSRLETAARKSAARQASGTEGDGENIGMVLKAMGEILRARPTRQSPSPLLSFYKLTFSLPGTNSSPLQRGRTKLVSSNRFISQNVFIN